MKQISNYITEKFKINSKTINNIKSSFNFESHITNKPYKFKDVNWIVPSGSFKPMRFSILIEYAKEVIDLNLLEDQKDIDFCKEWLQRAKKAYKNNYVNGLGWNSEQAEFTSLCNGEKYTFGNAKFTYDLLQYGLSKSDTTIPRRKKLEKMIRDFWDEVDNHKNEMNWY